ncbi:peptidase [Leuconostoc litchii]|uniref:Endopeptidase n=1 Tax=Leuconostoc litchii TaxID=1981069 RepID=A0A6P2CQA7_9LACO|nr:M13-type metalloendopeptidase [Leuconostoc litchii]TYC46332.1 endopeptidase [Leuconostoc litchii]GMA70056.1 peptidase [Leuconostoc litchii]
MVRIQDDFFEAVNGDWEKKAIIPADKPRTGGFSDLSDDIEEWLLDTTAKWQEGRSLPNDKVLNNFIKYHRLASDFQARNQIGVTPVLPIIKKYQSFTSFSDFASQISELEDEGFTNAFPFGVEPDFKDARTNVLWAGGLDILLPDTTYYTKDHPQKAELLAKFREEQETLLPKFGFSESETTDLIDKYLLFDARVAQVVLSQEEGHEYAKLYHPYKWSEFVQLAPELPLNDILSSLIGQLPDMVVVPEERFWKNANQFYSEEAWPLLKAYLLVKITNQFTAYLSDEIRISGGIYQRALTGLPEAMSQEKSALYLATAPYNQAIGLHYASKKFSPEAKADVEKKVASMIAVYKDRLKSVSWLKEGTRNKAITKLNTIVPHIGYPEKLPERIYQKIVSDHDTLFEAAVKFRKIEITHAWNQWHQSVDRSEWHMPAHLVNAYYDPQQNQIVFPAAILQKPFYSLDQSSSANYGGIGAVIAHEISHAFDTNGASFDEYGSLNDWWTKEDYAAFKVRTDKIVEQFDGIDSYGAKVNGHLTVSENVADLGGLAAALQAAKNEEDFSADQFFVSWATIWRMKARPEYMKLLAASDPHGPAKLRVNVQVKNFNAFFDAFHVTNGDGMWLAPESRVQIW